MENVKVVYDEEQKTYRVSNEQGEEIGCVFLDGDEYSWVCEYNGQEQLGYYKVEEAIDELVAYYNGEYKVYKAKKMTVAELREFLAIVPQDYTISIMGITQDIYINIKDEDKYICFDEYDLNDY